jgi:hypothetical protein
MYQISTRLKYGHPDYYRAIDLANQCNQHGILTGRYCNAEQMEEIMYFQPSYRILKLTVEPMYVLGRA